LREFDSRALQPFWKGKFPPEKRRPAEAGRAFIPAQGNLYQLALMRFPKISAQVKAGNAFLPRP
jgi:hypothetical protein